MRRLRIVAEINVIDDVDFVDDKEKWTTILEIEQKLNSMPLVETTVGKVSLRFWFQEVHFKK